MVFHMLAVFRARPLRHALRHTPLAASPPPPRLRPGAPQPGGPGAPNERAPAVPRARAARARCAAYVCMHQAGLAPALLPSPFQTRRLPRRRRA
jgi:hypothetical protein